MSEKVRFANSRGMEIVGVIDKAEDTNGEAPAVILSHSFTGFKEIPHLHKTAKELQDRGIHALRFDFTDCVGESDGKCEEMKLSNQVQNLKDALAFMREKEYVDADRIGLFGHSLGGMTSIIVAAEDGVQALAVAGAPAYQDLKHLIGGEDAVDAWKEQGYHMFDSFKQGEVRVNWSFVEDMSQYDACAYMAKVSIPVRIIHGDEDDIVPLPHGEKLFKHANPPKELHIIAGSDHLYTKDGAERELVQLAAGWMGQQLL
jgi:esterase/lipase